MILVFNHSMLSAHDFEFTLMKSYTREHKLVDLLRWYSLNGQSLYCTCQEFSLNTETVSRWVKERSAIYNSKPETRMVSEDSGASRYGRNAV